MRTPRAADASVSASPGRGELLQLVPRFVLALALMALLVGGLGYFARKPAEALAVGFVEHFGVGGMALGTALADTLHFPVPPQFYMLLAVASNTPALQAFPAIALASVVSGYLGFHLAKWASGVPWLERKTARYRALLSSQFQRRGYRIALVASLLPIPYSVLCYASGLNRMPLSFLAMLCAFRVPKLIVFYALVYFGWSLS